MVGKGKRKGARKTAASKPKAEARGAAAARKVGAGSAKKSERKPKVAARKPLPAMESGTPAVPGDQPPPQDLRANDAILRAWQEPSVTPPQTGIQGATATAVAGSLAQGVGVAMTVIRAAPALRPGWEASRDEVLSRAAEVVDLYQRLGAILAPAIPGPGSPGHNRGSILEEGLAELHDYQATAELATELFQERARPGDPDTKVIKQSGNVFKTLVHGTQAFGVTVSRWIVEGLVKGEVVKYAPGLVEQLVGALRTLAEVIASLFQ